MGKYSFSSCSHGNSDTDYSIFSKCTDVFSIFSFSWYVIATKRIFLQETVEENNLVNVYSVLEVISTLAFSVFVLLMSYIAENFGISISFWLSAICLMIEAILIYIRRNYFK